MLRRINAQHAQQHRVLRMIAALEAVASTPDDVQMVGVTPGTGGSVPDLVVRSLFREGRWASISTGRGASNATIAGLPTRTLPRKRKVAARGGGAPAGTDVAGQGTEEADVALGSCCICMEDYKGGQKVCTLPCSHAFHFGCCKKWLKEHAICCVCRAPVGSAATATT